MLALCRIAKHQRFPRSTLVQFHRYSTDADSDDESTWHEQDEEPFIVCIEQPNVSRNPLNKMNLYTPQQI